MMLPPPVALEAVVDAPGRWHVRELAAVGSTNEFAANLGPWEAVVAQTQSAGRGRQARRWISDAGGLWMSAVLPTPPPREAWSILPLAAGWAVCRAVTAFGLKDVRLRWPNDVMIGSAKLAGVLVERFHPATAVVGIGLNYDNRPERIAPELSGAVARLADGLSPLPGREAVREALLDGLTTAYRWIATGRASILAAELEPYWRRGPVHVSLRCPTGIACGTFTGVDGAGRLHLQSSTGAAVWLGSSEVELLREIFPSD